MGQKSPFFHPVLGAGDSKRTPFHPHFLPFFDPFFSGTMGFQNTFFGRSTPMDAHFRPLFEGSFLENFQVFRPSFRNLFFLTVFPIFPSSLSRF